MLIVIKIVEILKRLLIEELSMRLVAELRQELMVYSLGLVAIGFVLGLILACLIVRGGKS